MQFTLSYEVASGSEINACIKIDKPLVVFRFSNDAFNRHVYMANPNVFKPNMRLSDCTVILMS